MALKPGGPGFTSQASAQTYHVTMGSSVNPWELQEKTRKHEFSVDMTCEGCSNAVSRVLNKLGGVEFDIDLPNKKVCINSEHSVDLLLETLGKTGKAVSYLGPK
ncbi:copper transport protein ATOX1 [Acinonyx jubatus]|uniref:Copper transport protein ATOX1 n=1 Tax=Acinonyx jubatus TaxID=32536 RepID=A0ABM3Q5F7_ACIJB|nr:copper transport protein ATOX1 [Acinonyx jubatus]